MILRRESTQEFFCLVTEVPKKQALTTRTPEVHQPSLPQVHGNRRDTLRNPQTERAGFFRARAARFAEPNRRLTEKPDHVPQWCSKHWLKAGDRKGGGKRRRAS